MARVVVYGNSLVVATLGASLAACAEMELLPVDAPLDELPPRLDALAPDALLFGATAARSDLVVRLLRDRPGLILIGADPATDALLVLSGRQEQPVSAADLAQLIVQPQAQRQGRSL